MRERAAAAVVAAVLALVACGDAGAPGGAPSRTAPPTATDIEAAGAGAGEDESGPPGVDATMTVLWADDVESADVRFRTPNGAEVGLTSEAEMATQFQEGRVRYTVTAKVVGKDGTRRTLRETGTMELSDGDEFTITASTTELRIRWT